MASKRILSLARAGRVWRARVVFAAACCMAGVCPGLALAADAAAPAAAEPAEPSKAVELAHDLYITEQLFEGEKTTTQTLREALIERAALGGQRQFSADRLSDVSARDAALKALQANLTIARGTINEDIAGEVLKEAAAVFNPTLSVSVNYDQSATHDRTEQDQRYKQGTTVIIDDNGLPHDAVTFERSIITYLGFDQERRAGPGHTTIQASQSTFTGPDETWSYELGISQILPWGGSFSMTQELTYKVANFIVNEGSRAQGQAVAGNYHRPWTVSTTGTVSLPFPLTRNFGREASDDSVNLELSRIAQSASVEQLAAVVNDTLLAVDIAYYDLVRAGINVEATLKNREQSRTLLKKTKAMYELGEATAYHLARVESDLARADGDVELVLTDYRTASNTLRRLLNEDADLIYLPVGYMATMQRSSSFTVDSIDSLNPDANPFVRVENENLRAAEINQRKAELQTRPDINLDVSVTWGQVNDVFGYDDYTESYGHMFDADMVNQDFTASFVRPWGNRNAVATRDEATNARDAQELQRKLVWNNARRQIHDALIDHVSAKHRLQIAEKRFDLANQAYAKAVEQQRNRSVTEYEIIQLGLVVLEAHRSLISALVDTKQAEARVLAGAGMLAERYAERTSQSALDMERIEQLRAAHPLHFFAESEP